MQSCNDSSEKLSRWDNHIGAVGLEIEACHPLLIRQCRQRLVAQSKIHRIVTTDRNYLFMDVGGGSTELNLYVGGEPVATRSFDIGTVRMLSGVVRDATFEAFDQYLSERSGLRLKRVIRCSSVSAASVS